MLGSLAAELALNISLPPAAGACPSGSQDQDELSLEYGGGCVSDTGLSETGLSGAVNITLAGGSGVFVGDINSLGFPDLPVLGSVSGQVSRAGNLVTADIEFSSISWTDSGLDNVWDGLFEITIDNDDIFMDVASGSMLRGGDPEFEVDLQDIIPAPASLDSCWVPQEGQVILERAGATATVGYSEVAHATGQVPVVYGSEDTATITPCD